MVVNVLRRRWAEDAETVDDAEGRIYDFLLMANDGRKFDYGAMLEQTRRDHDHRVHIGLDTSEGTLRMSIPAVLGSAVIIPVVETILAAARSTVRRGRNPSARDATTTAAEWPGYVLGPDNPLTYLASDMPCSFFIA